MDFFHEREDLPCRGRNYRKEGELPLPAWGDPSFVVDKVVPTCQQIVPQGSRWPDRTDLACLWCEEGFDWAPVGAPVHHNARKDEFVLRWNFCSFNCCKAWMLDRRMPQVSNVFWLAMRLYGADSRHHRRLEGIQPAPSKEALKKYGGWMTIEEFRSNCQLIRPATAHGINVRWDPVHLCMSAAAEMAVQSRGARSLPAAPQPAVPAPRAAPPPTPSRPNTLDTFLKSGKTKPRPTARAPPATKRAQAAKPRK